MSRPPREILDNIAVLSDLVEEEGDPINDRLGLGEALIDDVKGMHKTLGYLQRLVIGEGETLPHAPPCVRIVVARNGWKEDYAFLYGFSSPTEPKLGETSNSKVATRVPEEATSFAVYYRGNYGPGGYSRVEVARELEPEVEQHFRSGDFTDEEAERLLEDRYRVLDLYWELMEAARDADLNPDFAERVTKTFYENAG